RLFRRLFLARLSNAYAADRLAFFGDLEGLRRRREAFLKHLAPLRTKNWFVYAKPPFQGPEAVLAYLARYTHRAAISNSRLPAPPRVPPHKTRARAPARRAGGLPEKRFPAAGAGRGFPRCPSRPRILSGAPPPPSSPKVSPASATTGYSPAPDAKPILRAPKN